MKVTIQLLVEGGNASGGPPLGPAIGPIGLNIQEVVDSINEKTKEFSGLKIPVDVIVDKNKKTYEIEIGSPPVSELLKKEAKIEKGRGASEPVGDITLEQVIKVAKMNSSKSLAKNLKNQVKEILGTCISVGITVNGKSAKEITREVEEKKHDSLLL